MAPAVRPAIRIPLTEVLFGCLPRTSIICQRITRRTFFLHGFLREAESLGSFMTRREPENCVISAIRTERTGITKVWRLSRGTDYPLMAVNCLGMTYPKASITRCCGGV